MTKFSANIAFGLLYVLATCLVLAALITRVDAATLTATDITGLRKFPGQPPLLLDFQAVKLTEDRTVAHFDVRSLRSAPSQASLFIPILNIDAGGADGTFEVYKFAGDGVVSVDEWDSGSLVRSYARLDQPGTLRLDVTEVLAAALSAGDDFVSFNYRVGAGSDRWWLGSTSQLPDSTIQAIPLPAALPLLIGSIAFGMLCAVRRSRPHKVQSS